MSKKKVSVRGLQCPECKTYGKQSVVTTDKCKDIIVRLRKCKVCGKSFLTDEVKVTK